jgi:hypothetical protein
LTTTFDDAVAIAEQLSPAEQARLVLLLVERLQQFVPGEVVSTAPSVEEPNQAEPAFWQVPDGDAEWAVLEAAGTLPQRHMLSHEAARSETRAMLRRWFGPSLSEAAVLELAMSGNLDR